VIRALWDQVDRAGGFDLAATPLAKKLRGAGVVSGRSTHADRIATIRDTSERYRIVIDPHTADGLRVGLAHRETDMPLICIETALAAKFAATIREALGQEPPRPAAYANLESLPQRFATLPVDTRAVKAYIGEHALA
jgi:threonine synthase